MLLPEKQGFIFDGLFLPFSSPCWIFNDWFFLPVVDVVRFSESLLDLSLTHGHSISSIVPWHLTYGSSFGMSGAWVRSLKGHWSSNTWQTHNPHIVLLQETNLLENRILSVKRNWIQRAFHTTFSSYAWGVSILLHKCLRCGVQHVFSDPEKRYVAVYLETDMHRLAAISVYVPPPHFIEPFSIQYWKN